MSKRRSLLALCLVLLLPIHAAAAVAILDTGTGSGLLGAHVGSGSYTFAKAVSAGSQRALVACAFKNGAAATIGAATYGGQSMSPVAVMTGVSPSVRCYSLLESGIAGAANTTISVAVNDDTDDFLIAAMSFTGVVSVTTAGTPTMNDGTSPGSLSITGLTANDYVVGFANVSDNGATTTAGTETGGYRLSTTWANVLASLAGSSGTLTWTYSGGELALGQALGLVGGSTTTTPKGTLLGVLP